jgi:hypothetical protein
LGGGGYILVSRLCTSVFFLSYFVGHKKTQFFF